MQTVLITDYAWPDLAIERGIIESAGMRLVAGPCTPAAADAIAKLVREHQPDSVLTCWAQVDGAAVRASARLRHVGRIGVGLDNIDVPACTARGVAVTNVPDYCVEEVSDHVLALTLAWARGVTSFDRDVRAGHWNPAAARLRRVNELTIGVIGHGRIGKQTVRKFSALGCRVLVQARSQSLPPAGVEMVGREELLQASDVIVLHVPLTAQTRHMVDRSFLARLKRGAFLVNVSRGAVVDTQALIESLQSGQLSGAGLDVLESEPEVPQALLAHPGVVLSPHLAFSSESSLAELRERATREAVRVLSGGQPRHLCNAPE